MVDVANCHWRLPCMHSRLQDGWPVHLFDHWHGCLRGLVESFGHSSRSHHGTYNIMSCARLYSVNVVGILWAPLCGSCLWFDYRSRHCLFVLLLGPFRDSHSLWHRGFVHESSVPGDPLGQRAPLELPGYVLFNPIKRLLTFSQKSATTTPLPCVTRIPRFSSTPMSSATLSATTMGVLAVKVNRSRVTLTTTRTTTGKSSRPRQSRLLAAVVWFATTMLFSSCMSRPTPI